MKKTHQKLKFHHESSEDWKSLNRCFALCISHGTRIQRENELSAVSCVNGDPTTVILCWVKNAMASVRGLPVRWSRLKIENFRQFSRNFSTNQQINRKLNSGRRYWWYLLGGSVCAGAYFRWQQLSAVTAFNPKKMKVSCLHLLWFIFKFIQCSLCKSRCLTSV